MRLSAVKNQLALSILAMEMVLGIFSGPAVLAKTESARKVPGTFL